MKIQIKNKDLVEVVQAIIDVLNCSISDSMIVYRLNKILKLTREQLAIVQEVKRELAEHYADQDENGEPVIIYPDKDNPAFSAFQIRKQRAAHRLEKDRLDAEYIEVECNPIPYSELWKKAKRKEFRASISVLMGNIIDCSNEENEE